MIKARIFDLLTTHAGLTTREIAHVLGLTREQVSQALRKLGAEYVRKSGGNGTRCWTWYAIPCMSPEDMRGMAINSIAALIAGKRNQRMLKSIKRNPRKTTELERVWGWM